MSLLDQHLGGHELVVGELSSFETLANDIVDQASHMIRLLWAALCEFSPSKCFFSFRKA